MQSDTVIKRFESLPEITEAAGANKNGEPDDGKLSSPVRRAVHGCSL